MCTCFGLCILGLFGGVLYVLFVVLAHHRTLDSVLGNSIPFFKTLGAIGVLGLVLFFAFLISSIAARNKNPNSK